MLIREMKTGIRKSRRRKLTAMNVLAFLVMFLLAAALPFLKESTDTLTTLTATPGTMIVLFFMGIIAAATMVIPGVSGSMILMILGYYYGVINSITGFMDALKAGNWNALLGEAAILIPFGIGCVLGIFLIAKLIEYLFERHTVSTYAAILGLILSSPFGIFHNTGALAHVTVGGLIIGIILMIAGAFGTWYMGETR